MAERCEDRVLRVLERLVGIDERPDRWPRSGRGRSSHRLRQPFGDVGTEAAPVVDVREQELASAGRRTADHLVEDLRGGEIDPRHPAEVEDDPYRAGEIRRDFPRTAGPPFRTGSRDQAGEGTPRGVEAARREQCHAEGHRLGEHYGGGGEAAPEVPERAVGAGGARSSSR